MEFKDATKMTNAEIRLYQETLTNEFERIKKRMLDDNMKLNELDREWVNVQRVINERKTKIDNVRG